MEASPQQVAAGQAVYTRRNLNIYDLVVHGVSNPWIWHCPTRQLIDHYNRHVSGNHLDVGVGTGYLLDKCRFPSTTPRVALMDLNQNTLDYASVRIARYRPESYQRNVLEPIPFEAESFDSIGLNYLLHCIPGTITSKAVAFDHLASLLNPGGVIFGSTLLQEGVERSWLARHLMTFYNHKGIFSNKQDSLDGLRQALEQRFSDVFVEVIGCAALFVARK
jgi:SAM-dependent methyltransferase